MSSTRIPAVRRAIISDLLDAIAESAPAEDALPGQRVPAAIAQPDYARGIIDLLTLFGAVRPTSDGGTVEAVSPQAGWAIRMIRTFIDNDAPIIDDWQSRGVTPIGVEQRLIRATDLLAALEYRRQSLVPGAAPLREVEASVGLISRRGDEGVFEILLVYDPHARAWQLPGGRYDSTDATPTAALLRELHEELGLSATATSEVRTIEPMPPVHETRMSPTYGLMTRVSFHMYRAILKHHYFANTNDVRWVRVDEIEAGKTTDGMAIAVGALHIQAAQSGTQIVDILASPSTCGNATFSSAMPIGSDSGSAGANNRLTRRHPSSTALGSQ
ncbi:NUDIX hydrolase [Chloroflexales bacterium ZM16-3]|nr:NUDIX hydrolase [Chloroflexales bacterium ZM16-3]